MIFSYCVKKVNEEIIKNAKEKNMKEKEIVLRKKSEELCKKRED